MGQKTPLSSQREILILYLGGGNNLRHQYRLGSGQLEIILAKKALVVPLDTRLYVILPLYPELVRHTWIAESIYGLPSMRETGTYWDDVLWSSEG